MKQVDAYPNYSVTETGEVWSYASKKPKKLKPYPIDCGYLTVNLCKNGKMRTFVIHRLVAEAFIQNPDNLPFVCHKNDIRSDNRAENLFWGTHQDNMDDRNKKGRQAKGKAHGSSKLADEQVLEIRKIGKSKTQEEIAKIYGIHRSLVGYILNRKLWTHI